MDDLEAVYNLNRDKALVVLTASGNLIIFTIVTVITVFIPLAFTLSKNSPELMALFTDLITVSPIVIIPVFGFFFFKYREYKDLYIKSAIKSIVQNYFQKLPNNSQTPDYDLICKEVVRITDIEYDKAMNLLFEIFPIPTTTPIINQ